MKKKFIEGIGYAFFVRIFSVLISFLFIYLIANYLGPSDYGVFSYILSVIGTIPGITGVYILISAVTRYISETKNKRLFLNLLKYVFILLIPIFIFVLFGAGLISNLLKKDITLPLMLFSLGVIFFPLYDLLKGLLMAFKEFKKVAIIEIILKSFNLGAALFLIYALSLRISGLIFASLFSYAFTIVLMFFHYKKLPFVIKPIQIKKGRIRRYVSTGYISSVIRRVSSFVFLFIYGLFLTSGEMGVYSLAEKAIFVAILLSDSITQTLFPVISEFAKDGKRVGKYCSGSIKLSLLISATFFFVVLLFGKPVLGIFFPKYIDAYPIAVLLCLSQIFNFSILSVVFSAKERLDLLSAIFLIELAIYGAGGYFLMSLYGILGAVLTRMTAILVFSFFVLVFLRKTGVKISLRLTPEDITLIKKGFNKLRNRF